jgi:hypothetical protein
MNHYPCGGDKVSKDKDPCRESMCISDTCWIQRPKFFNGQLLTDVDLKTGLDYVMEKNKLHNRHLHGWGVVCGLKVKCYPCCQGHGSSGKVVVEPGYAIDCCGNDIVVCQEQDYDVVKRINEMIKKKKAQSSPCEPGVVLEESDCPDQEGKYYLTLSYKEEDAKPVAALKGNDPCSIQSCVPSRTRECFELGLVNYCTLDPSPEENLFTRMRQCLTLFTETWTRVVGNQFNGENLLKLSADQLKTFISEYYKSLPSNVHCDLLDQLEEDAGQEQSYALLVQVLIDCLCQAILNPCPQCGEDDLVILATLTVKNNKIHKICNFSRKYILTSLSFNYWFAPFINVVVSALFSSLGKENKFKIDSFPDLAEFLCCVFDISKRQSEPPYAYILKSLENDFDIPKIMGMNFTKSLSTLSKGFAHTIDPQNVSLKSALGKKTKESQEILKRLDINVKGTELYEPTIEDVTLGRLLTTRPFAAPGSRVVQLVDDKDNVVGFRVVEGLKKEPAKPADQEMKAMKKMLTDMSQKINVMEKELKEIKSKNRKI